MIETKPEHTPVMTANDLTASTSTSAAYLHPLHHSRVSTVFLTAPNRNILTYLLTAGLSYVHSQLVHSQM